MPGELYNDNKVHPFLLCLFFLGYNFFYKNVTRNNCPTAKFSFAKSSLKYINNVVTFPEPEKKFNIIY